MNKLLLVLLVFLTLNATAQQPVQVCYTFNESSVVKDSTGKQIAFAVWQKLLQSGKYTIMPPQNESFDADFVLYDRSAAEKVRLMESSPMPRETSNFKTGSRMPNFKFTDLQGNKFNLKNLAGKVIVLNFWFINCGPCRKEIPDLNKLVLKYKDNQDVIFLGIGLDSRSEIKDFLKKYPFLYNITEDGRYLAQSYGIESYPTHVVIDRSAKVLFHTNGLANNTVYWIEKSILKALNGPETVSSTGKL
jgi:thiol-disulfide isomerase/thioredoxin